jgi:hypothetical protein
MYRYVLGIICEATGMRWVFGLKTHTEEDVESCINLFLASMRLLRPDLSIDIIRSDGAPENRSHHGFAFLEAQALFAKGGYEDVIFGRVVDEKRF